ncbi:hexokinase-1-like [Macrosteles quadrilineatus]|uniref:hexokinase-1-like n=1 Tax=Macrosteles quadrilineatus TaxID=74068 RepID=UPI0023E189F2|nr:hexokinase-1-like [Macrosteles quadrilineatus]XP_054264646.1 hexokinase-1-like [Macrosteles quadrilineatus]
MSYSKDTMSKLNEALILQPLKISDGHRKKQIEDKLIGLYIDGPTVSRIRDIFMQELRSGLKGETSAMLMLNTFISQLPDDSEEGQFLALDLGGTNFRVLHVMLEKGQIVDEQSESYHIENELRVGRGTDLFDFIAKCISSFLQKYQLTNKKLPLGFTFSFPMKQTSLSSAQLLMWTLSFSASGVEGEDVVKLLTEALERNNLSNVSVVAIINDSTGTLLHGVLKDRNTNLGVILGTGTNGCYWENTDNVPHWGYKERGIKQVAVNTEWGCIADTGLLDFVKTPYDEQVDQNSVVKNICVFEKFTGGGFLGELVRYALVDLANSGLIFEGTITSKLLNEDSFPSSFITEVEKDSMEKVTTRTEEILKNYDQSYSQDDVAVLKYLCEMVSKRAALLISICCAEVLKYMNKPKNTVAVDGSFYKYHPRIRLWMNDFVSIMAPDHKCNFIEADDGSGKGAAIAAAVALKLQQHSSETA